MEKSTPHYHLSIIKTLIHEGHVRATSIARKGATSLGFNFDGMIAIILTLGATDFYKSMTTHIDHRVWQDVNRPITPKGEIYLKLTVIDGVLIVSFKEL